ncbi:hypothetical protein HPB50_001341 [Hyalomma asiaticum]|uniref:Uncharacterized protein n=1 Tax=Hyalomma asiaticum TaxID=266040 RepID=A0ACB7TD33_HYAAI|nr:hypothetical protein HPB50_001341 [Hyalomma asiaticum]
MIRHVSASAASTDARSFAADDRSRRLDNREYAVETRRSGEHFYTIPADNRYLCTYYVHVPGSCERRQGGPRQNSSSYKHTHHVNKQAITRENSAGSISHQNAEIVDRSSASNRPELVSTMALPY